MACGVIAWTRMICTYLTLKGPKGPIHNFYKPHKVVKKKRILNIHGIDNMFFYIILCQRQSKHSFICDINVPNIKDVFVSKH